MPLAARSNEPSAEGSAGAKEFVFTRDDFERIRRLIYDHAGIQLNPGKMEMVYSRLARRLRANNVVRFSEYLRLLEGPRGAEWEAFTNALTTNLTAFFREAHHFVELEKLIRRVSATREVSLWCSAASTGEEPYSMAMTAVEACGSTAPRVKIVASDVDTAVLAKAQAGVYTMDRVDRLAPERLRRFFLRGSGANEGMVRVRPELSSLIRFQQVNLLDARYPVTGPFDAIFCRNVMIYFDKPTQYKILQRFAPLLRPDGLLFAGHSENFYHAADLFKLRAKTVYELANPPAGAA
ncbi:MAG: chemotaxis protein CheR [Burkholderiales bacterium]|jgi:chemotaxis protein methyltransferase CheR|nr:chemotaxis protein CheR [Burkholderiales bacterium]